MWFFLYFFLHLVIYSLVRLEFLIWNWASLKSLSYSELIRAFVHGLRFDISVLAYTLGLAFLGFIWLSGVKKASKYWLVFFAVLNAAFLALNTIDVELFNFTAKRFAFSSFFLAQEAQFSNMIAPYWGLALASAVLVFGYLGVAWMIIPRLTLAADLKKKLMLTLALLFAAVLASRGGFQHKPLTYVDAKLFNNSYANNLVLNTTFTLLKSMTQKSLQRVQHFENGQELLSWLVPQTKLDFEVPSTEKPLNVVILILESFSSEYVELQNPEVTPFFNKLAKQSVYFPKAFANGRRSIEGIAAILSGIPALMEEPFINSEFSANQIIGLGQILSQNGYESAFFHGAHRGSMHFDSFMKSVGIEMHFSAEDYPDKKDHDGTWGIYDEPFLNWSCGKINEFQTPFLAAIFTLSSHQPYKIPEKYSQGFQDNRHEILKAVRYADYSLEQFLKCAEQQSWYQNTIFILTADHTGPALQAEPEFVSRYEVPLMVYAPGMAWINKVNRRQVAQHIDILPTLLDLLKIDHKNKNYLARSLLRSGSKFAVFYSDGQYEMTGDILNADLQLKAVQQYFSQGLYDNRLYYPVKAD